MVLLDTKAAIAMRGQRPGMERDVAKHNKEDVGDKVEGICDI